MTKFWEKRRKALRMVFRVFGLAAVATIFTACYGPMLSPMPDDEHWNSPPTVEGEETTLENSDSTSA